jgi:hypothetical protein
MLGYMGFSALAVQEERSFAEPGKRVGSDLVTIVDDASDPATLPMAFDYEGVAKQRVSLIERGICRDVVYDSQTAARAGRTSTGHGLPAPNPYGPFPLNMAMTAGETPRRELIAGLERGPSQARHRHRDDPRRDVPRAGWGDRRAGPEPALHAELPRRAGGDVGRQPGTADAARGPRRGARAGDPGR